MLMPAAADDDFRDATPPIERCRCRLMIFFILLPHATPIAATFAFSLLAADATC